MCGGRWWYLLDVVVRMSQYFVEYIATRIVPLCDGVALVIEARMRTPYGVVFLNFRSMCGHTTVASRPTG